MTADIANLSENSKTSSLDRRLSKRLNTKEIKESEQEEYDSDQHYLKHKKAEKRNSSHFIGDGGIRSLQERRDESKIKSFRNTVSFFT